MSEDLNVLARRLCLQNAVQHGGKANGKALVGRVMASHPEYRSQAQAVAEALVAAANTVNAMSLEEQNAALAAEAPELLNQPKKEQRTGLKPLPNVQNGPDGKPRVVMRFAPNPNGPLSLGHSRGVSILAEYQRMYEADLILRFDDTDPQIKPPLMDKKRGWNGYDMIASDFEWLTGIKPTRIVTASDRIAIYHDAARTLIAKGGAYVCTCPAEVFRELKAKAEPCPHREASIASNQTGFEDMVAGRTAKGGAVLRIKTDIKHPHPGLRDWTAFRVVSPEAIHPREALGEIPRHHCWPLLDFQSAIEDHLQGVTHVIRGKDLMDSTRKQTFLYKHMGWTYPDTLYWGRVSVHEFGKFSTSMMRRAIEAGQFSGWDDPRLPCLAALRRRGYNPGAIRSFWVSLGLTEKDIAVSLSNLDAEDAKAIEPDAMRYFFVPNPKPIHVEGIEDRVAKPLLHPAKPDLGTRTLKGESAVVIAKSDLAPRLRLKDLGNIELYADKARFTTDTMDRAMPIVQWLPASAAKPFTVLKPEFVVDETAPDASGETEPEAPTEMDVPPLVEIKGLVEAAAVAKIGRVVQFERFGFVRIESPELGIWLHG